MQAFSQTPTGIDYSAIDKSVEPCDNFYQYACGLWRKNNPIPSDKARWGRFDELADRNRAALRDILEKASVVSMTRTPAEQKIGDQYASCMDEKAIDAKGTAAIAPRLDGIAQLTSKGELAAELARLHSSPIADPGAQLGGGLAPLFRFGTIQDSKDATATIADLSQSGLGMPDRDYYLKTDPRSVEIRAAYVAHVAKMFGLLSHSPERAAAEARAVIAIETALAQVSADRVTLRDPQKRYHSTTVPELAQMASAIDWKAYFAGIGLTVKSLNVAVPDFVKGMNGVVERTSLDDLKTYLTWHTIHRAAPLMPSAFAHENFEFAEKTLLGVQQAPPRWRTCAMYVDKQLGDALGRVYVERAFGGAAKERTLQMVSEIETEMAKDIQSLTWMSDVTKEQALGKLHAVANKIGYPEKWKDYADVRIARGDALGNSERAGAAEFRRTLEKIGKPVDKSEWSMTPPTVNAYYSPSMNNINFPAGILQPPFYFRDGDEAANYGAVGAVVGHELTHGFDDQGRQYDGGGNLRDWWTAADAKNFKDRAECIVKEYEGFVATGDTHLNGRLTLGENGADNGGVRLAYMALVDSLSKHSLSEMNGYTPQQRFFLAYAQVWCENTTDAAARQRALTDPHSPGRYRINGVLQNMPEFQETFGCKAGQNMVSQNACRIW